MQVYLNGFLTNTGWVVTTTVGMNEANLRNMCREKKDEMSTAVTSIGMDNSGWFYILSNNNRLKLHLKSIHGNNTRCCMYVCVNGWIDCMSGCVYADDSIFYMFYPPFTQITQPKNYLQSFHIKIIISLNRKELTLAKTGMETTSSSSTNHSSLAQVLSILSGVVPGCCSSNKILGLH